MNVELLTGLPPYGPMPTAYPETWARTGREGTVVQFESKADKWVGNFQPGLGGLDLAEKHPNNRDAVIFAGGDLWVVNGETRAAERLLPAVYTAIPVSNPAGWVLDRQGIALARLGPDGLVWHTRRLSWDGFDELRVEDSKVFGLSWSPMDNSWAPFEVDLVTGQSIGGSFSDQDDEKWENLAIAAK